MPGARALPDKAGLTVWLKTDDGAAEGEDEDADDEHVALPPIVESIPLETNMFLGWRCSYKKSHPEDHHHMLPSVKRVLKRKLNAMEPIKHIFGDAKRHRPVKQRDTSRKKSLEKQRRAALKLLKH